MNSPVSSRSTAHSPNPRSRQPAIIRSTISSLCCGVSVDGKWRMTSGSPFRRRVRAPGHCRATRAAAAARSSAGGRRHRLGHGGRGTSRAASTATPATTSTPDRAVEHERQPMRPAPSCRGPSTSISRCGSTPLGSTRVELVAPTDHVVVLLDAPSSIRPRLTGEVGCVDQAQLPPPRREPLDSRSRSPARVPACGRS